MNSYEINTPELSLVCWARTARPVRVQLPSAHVPRLDDVLYTLVAAALAFTAVVVGMLA